MLSADPTDLTRTAPPARFRARLAGWGGGTAVSADVVRPFDLAALAGAVAESTGAGRIARGLGRSYGDAAQLSGGTVIDTTGLRAWELDDERGILTAQAGVRLGTLLRELVPRGYTVPVVPGTQHVTLGGMIASDVHGKNHGAIGSLGAHVRALGLVTADGELVDALPDDDAFAATLGGMGLTGIVAWARIALQPVPGPLLSVDTDRFESLDEALALLAADGGPHRVAWLDLLGPRVRGIVTRADYAPPDAQPGAAAGATVAARATVPSWWPGILPRAGVRAFNELRFRSAPRRERGRLEALGHHMFPLDALAAWPRLYGPAGFVQYQLVVPPHEEATLSAVIETLRRHDVPCFLAVLKDFGEAIDAPLSFPMRGWTLALDLPRTAPGLLPALARCDELVADARGRVYLSKDARLRPELLGPMYPRLEEWRETRARLDPDGRWRSDLGERLGLTAPVPAPASRDAPAPPSTAPRRVLLIGGTSEIGLAIVRRLAADGPLIVDVLGRDEDALRAALASLRDAGVAGDGAVGLDARAVETHDAVLGEAFARLGEVDVAVLAVGVLGGQAGLDASSGEIDEVLRVNVSGAGSLAVATLRRLREQGRGTLVVLSSVAAERPRASNPVYGAAKAALDALAQGLSDSLAGTGVDVVVVRPGFVTTRMTAGLDPAPLATTAEAVAEATARALAAGGSRTVWVPATLRPLFAVLRHLPRALYRRLPL